MATGETSGVPALEMRGISKTFPGVEALDNVRLKVHPRPGSSLMGENGAGKSTLMKILSGAYHADPGGQILIEGQPVQIDDPLAAKRHGIAIIYQELASRRISRSPRTSTSGDELRGARGPRRPARDGATAAARRSSGSARRSSRRRSVGDAVDRRAAAGRDRPGGARASRASS